LLRTNDFTPCHILPDQPCKLLPRVTTDLHQVAKRIYRKASSYFYMDIFRFFSLFVDFHHGEKTRPVKIDITIQRFLDFVIHGRCPVLRNMAITRGMIISGV
jgi:hypothetical protein